MKQISITKPDDWHLHIRTGALLQSVIGFTATQFARAIIMPNLTPPVTTVAHALNYRNEILQALPQNTGFQPLMTLYLTEATTLTEIQQVHDNPHTYALKLYPAGATTNSESGVTDIKRIFPILEKMQSLDIPLLIHGEVTSADIDIFDREKVFIDTHLTQIVAAFPELRIVLEHITTQEGVDFVTASSDNIAATITPQHLIYNRNAILVGGIKPHHYCLPVIKREKHRVALIKAATSGNQKFFLGTDSAPHLQQAKESACGCAGCFSAHAALEMYTEIFERVGALDKLEGFASFFGPDFYHLPRNKETVTLEKHEWTVPASYLVGKDKLIPLKAEQQIAWRLKQAIA